MDSPWTNDMRFFFENNLVKSREYSYQDIREMHLNTKYHEVILMMMLLIISVTYHTLQNHESDIITHVTQNTINNKFM